MDSNTPKKLEGESLRTAVQDLKRRGYTNTDIENLLDPEYDSAAEIKDGELVIDEDFLAPTEDRLLGTMMRKYRQLKSSLSRYENNYRKYPLVERADPEDVERLVDTYGIWKYISTDTIKNSTSLPSL